MRQVGATEAEPRHGIDQPSGSGCGGGSSDNSLTANVLAIRAMRLRPRSLTMPSHTVGIHGSFSIAGISNHYANHATIAASNWRSTTVTCQAVIPLDNLSIRNTLGINNLRLLI